ncbi:pectate lyase family protein [Sphingomonas colocasiae]|uniref:Pectate lyase n=1 Tax=Sphingomonas colocasiae TaxID=1848973 RepID=A0ABS7PSC6_9SPHN|nr:pectate lyase [Sphingomonas colocasiae]MBY8824181.1 pectate lyase [Sphingomonas colocasiae]
MIKTPAFLSALLLVVPVAAADLPASAPAPSQATAFPGAVGWGAKTSGGRGGRIIRVTSLAASGPGTLRAALEARGPRIVVFEVAGVIDLGRSSLEITEPYLTIAGQTAPSPGITIIKGGIDLKTHDVIVRHIRVRTGADGQAKRSGWEADSFSTIGAYNVIVDHCTFTWGVDENMSASGPRFTGNTPDEWRRGASHDITFSYNLAAEGLADSSHPKGEHSKGSLVHDNAANILFYRNVWAHNVERSPLLKGGVHAALVNNLIYDPGKRAVHYNLMALEWAGHAYQDGRLSAVGNVMRGGPSTDEGLPFLMLGGDGDLRYYGRDNIAVDRHGRPLPMFGRYGETRARLIEEKAPPPGGLPVGLDMLAARDVETHVLARAGARPWDRDADDLRVLFFVAEGRGAIIDDEKDVSAYPVVKPVHAPFVEQDWDLASMEPKNGVYPGASGPVQEVLSDRDRAIRR